MLAAAAAARVGVDVERVARRSDAFRQRALTAAERERLGGGADEVDDLVTELWSLKEAAGKALGLGIPNFLPSQIELSPFSAGRTCSVSFSGGALERFTELGAVSAEGHADAREGFALAVVVVTLARGGE
jgi:phosphopantetheine--protein transferase-like protein